MHNKAVSYLARFQRAERLKEERARKAQERRIRLQRTLAGAGSAGDKSSQVGISTSPTPRGGVGHLINPFSAAGSRNHPLVTNVTPQPVNVAPPPKT